MEILKIPQKPIAPKEKDYPKITWKKNYGSVHSNIHLQDLNSISKSITDYRIAECLRCFNEISDKFITKRYLREDEILEKITNIDIYIGGSLSDYAGLKITYESKIKVKEITYEQDHAKYLKIEQTYYRNLQKYFNKLEKEEQQIEEHRLKVLALKEEFKKNNPG